MLPTIITVKGLALASYILFSFTGTITAFKVLPYNGPGCRSGALKPWVGGPDQGCISGQEAGAGVAASAVIVSTGDIDANFYTVFFSSDDCNPDTEIGHKDKGCFEGDYLSYAVWDVGS